MCLRVFNWSYLDLLRHEDSVEIHRERGTAGEAPEKLSGVRIAEVFCLVELVYAVRNVHASRLCSIVPKRFLFALAGVPNGKPLLESSTSNETRRIESHEDLAGVSC